jgi:hypothetical protein
MLAAELIRILERGSLESRLLALALHRNKRISVLDVAQTSNHLTELFIPSPEDQGYFYIFDYYQDKAYRG